MTTDETVIENESTDYKLGYDAGFEAGKQALKEEVEKGNREGHIVYSLKSYSMLSDQEVRNLLTFYKSLVLNDNEALASRIAAQSMAEQHNELLNVIGQDVKDMLQSVYNNTPSLESVTPVAITNLLTNQEEV